MNESPRQNGIKLSSDGPLSTSICEVVSVDERSKTIRLRMRLDNAVVEGTLPFDICPAPARVAGGAFYVDAYRIERDGNFGYALFPRPVDAAEEQMELGKLFGN